MLSMTGVVWLVRLGVGMTLTIIFLLKTDEYILCISCIPCRYRTCVSSDNILKSFGVVLNAYLSFQASGQVVSSKADNRFQSHTQFIQAPLPFGMETRFDTRHSAVNRKQEEYRDEANAKSLFVGYYVIRRAKRCMRVQL
jgi:hypothetical protein